MAEKSYSPADIRQERPRDRLAIAALHDAAFNGPVEGRLVGALRDCGASEISLVACEGETIVGHVLLSRLDAPFRALALAPVGVLPARQGVGIGSALIRRCLADAAERGWTAVFVLGEPSYYRRFGFDVEGARGYACAYAGDYFMIRASQPVPAAGAIIYPRPFTDLDGGAH